MANVGRPKMLNGKKSHTAVMLSEKERDKARELADNQGMSLSAYIRLALIERMTKDEKSED